jgi:LPXTG-site transpeptidase (sortase) family protein
MRVSTVRRNSANALLVLLGICAVAAGFVLTAYGFYRLLDSDGTTTAPTLASQHRTDPGVVYDRPLGTVAEEPEPAAAVAPAAEPPLRDSSYRMVIDSIGVNANVFPYGIDANRIPEVPLNAEDIAWYDFSARPGTGGNAVFAGHVTWNGRAVFYDLDDLAVGQQIFLRGDNGTELAYTVSESYVVDPNDPNAVSVMGPTPDDVLTLITCDGTFYYTGDPVYGGDYSHRRIVRATLSGLNQPAPAAATRG